MNDTIRGSPGPSESANTSPRTGGATREESAVADDASKTLGAAVKYGSIGGLIATVTMTVFRMPTSKSLPPTARFWATFVGKGEPEEYPVVALLLHLVYGTVGGVFFALLTPGSGDSEAAAESKGALLGTVYGVALSIFGMRVLLERLLDADPDTDERLVFHISHVVYGLTLGTWVGSRFGNA